MTQELSLSWDGTAIEFSDSLVDRALFGAPTFGPLSAEWAVTEFPGFGVIESGQPKLAPRDFSFTVQVTPKNSIAQRARGEAFDHMRGTLGPLLSAEKLRSKALWSRPDGGGTFVDSYLWARVNGQPGYEYTTQGGDGVAGMRPSGRMRVLVNALATFPYFVANTATVNGTLSVGGPVSVTNPGTRWVGWRLEILTSTANGSKVQLSDGTQTVVLQWSTATIEVGTIVEYWYPAADLGHPIGVYSWRSSGGVYLRAQAIPQPPGYLVFNPGYSGSVSMTLPGTSSGTTTANLKVHAVYGTL